MRIVVNPDQLRNLAQQMRDAGSELRANGQRVGNALSGIDFESRQKIGIESQVNYARQRANEVANRADELARYLDGRANAFEEADRGGAEAVTQINTAFVKYLIQTNPGLIFPRDQVNDAINTGNILNDPQQSQLLTQMALIPGAGLTVGLGYKILKEGIHFGPDAIKLGANLRSVSGDSYLGETIIRAGEGGRDLRIIGGLPAGLNHFKASPGNLFKYSGGAGLEAGSGKIRGTIGNVSDLAHGRVTLSGGLFVVGVGFKAYDNWEQFHGNIAKTAVGTVVDTALSTAFSAGGAAIGGTVGGVAVGALLGAISGGALAPVGVAVGAKVGGFVGAVGGGWLYDKVVDKPVASVINKVSSWFGW